MSPSFIFRRVAIACFTIILIAVISVSCGKDRGREELIRGKAALETKDYANAVTYFMLAADKGSAEAQYELAQCYYWGKGVERDDDKFLNWIRKAAENGHAEAQFILAKCCEKDIGNGTDGKEVVDWYRKAAENGHAEAQYELALRYYEGRGVEPDGKKAVNWIRKAAENDHAGAQYFLAKCYEEGFLGVKKDIAEAIKWYRKAGEKRNGYVIEAEGDLKRLGAIPAGAEDGDSLRQLQEMDKDDSNDINF